MVGEESGSSSRSSETDHRAEFRAAIRKSCDNPFNHRARLGTREVARPPRRTVMTASQLDATEDRK